MPFWIISADLKADRGGGPQYDVWVEVLLPFPPLVNATSPEPEFLNTLK
jgi:hypothetical protein